jgi:hypothetical protein
LFIANNHSAVGIVPQSVCAKDQQQDAHFVSSIFFNYIVVLEKDGKDKLD